MAERRGHAVWHGNLLEGSGTVDAASGAVSGQEVTWKARTEGSDTVTSPEELIAAAEAACFAMALSHALASAGHEPEEVEVDAVCTFGPVEGGFAITRMRWMSGRPCRGSIRLPSRAFSPKPRQAAPFRTRCAATSRSTCAAGSPS